MGLLHAGTNRIGHAPIDGSSEDPGDVGSHRSPAELALQLSAVDGLAAFAAGRSETQSKSSESFPMTVRIMRRTVMLSLCRRRRWGRSPDRPQ